MKTVVIILCGQRRCALEREAISEIALVPDLSLPPSLPASVEGVMNLGGAAVIVVNLARLLGVPDDSDVDPAYRHVIVLGDAAERTALLVDRVEDVRRIASDAIMPVDAKTSVNDCVVGQIEIDGATVHLLDARKIFLAAESVRLAEIQQSEQARLDALGAA